MDQRTLDYYSRNGVNVFKRYLSVEGGISNYFEQVFKKGDRVLEIGFGSGRDLVRLLEMGVDALGVDPCRAFVDLAAKTFSKLEKRVYTGHLPDGLDRFQISAFNGILCSAVLMHIADADLDASFAAMDRLLKPGGNLLISIPGNRPDMDQHDRDSKGRLMVLRPRRQYMERFSVQGFTLKNEWSNADALSLIHI